MLTISTLQKHEFKQLLEALYLEEWFVQELQLEYLYAAFHNDFFIAKKDNTTVGFIVALKYHASFGFINNFVILKAFRSQGFGKELFTFALRHLKDAQIVLECDSSQEGFYKKHGFKSYFFNVTYKYVIDTNISTQLYNDSSIVDTYNKDLVFNYNKQSVFQKYANYLHLLIVNKTTQFKAMYEKDMLCAYGISFAYKDGYKVVLSANTIDESSALFFALIRLYPLTTSIYIEVLDTQKNLVELSGLLKMEENSRMSRMYNKIM